MKYLIIISLLLVSHISFCQKIDVKGKWRKTLDISDIKGIGGDYNDYFLSKKKQNKISVSAYPPSKQNNLYAKFKVFFHKEDNNWNPNIILQVRRTSRGTNKNFSISSGTEFQTVTNNPALFFQSVGRQKDVPIQYKVIGLSVLLPVQSYSTNIVFTVLDF